MQGWHLDNVDKVIELEAVTGDAAVTEQDQDQQQTDGN